MSHPIYIGFSTTNKITSRLIRWFTRSKVSHAWIRFYDDCLGQWMVMHSSFMGLEVALYDRFKAHNKILSEYESPVALHDAVRSLSFQLGQPYDYSSLFGQVWVQMAWRWFKKKVNNPLDDASKMVCSEFVCQVLQVAEVDGAEKLSPENVTPAELQKFMKEKVGSKTCGTT